MTRLFLAAGVAALAIASPASAKPGGGHGDGPHGGGQQQAQKQRGGGGQAMQQQRRGGGGGGFERRQVQMQQRGGGFERRQAQMQRVERPQRQQMRMERQAQNRGFERQQMRMERQAQNRSFDRQQLRANRMQQVQNRNLERQQLHAQRLEQVHNRNFNRQQLHADRMAQAQNLRLDRQQLRLDRRQAFQQQALAARQFDAARFRDARFRDDNLRFVRAQQLAYRQSLIGTSFAPLYYGAGSTILAPTIVERFVGVPVNYVTNYASLNPFPASMGYLYPTTNDYYYRYGDGYAYQVNRGTNLIAALIPLLAGGYMPGQYLPQAYRSSYVPNYYGFNSFYQDYGDTCNRYANGVIYQTDCYTGLVEDVIPMYAGGYGVGQILPASQAYYNVPYQYRTMYYDTPDYNYWYAPGAIYQYDRGSSMITSVAALLSPGFSVGQPLPAGYGVYNVPYAYRQTYYDTPNAWYRYNNGYIYQVDPATQLVTAIVASLLT